MSMLLNLGASFHPDLSGYENAEVAALLNGMSKAEFLKSIKGITEFSELDGALDAPVRTYSSGMALRLAFAVASSLNPKVLLVDEALAVGDQVFQQKCMDRIRELLASGTSLLVCSHDLVSLKSLCDRGLLLEGGAPQLLGSIDEVAKVYCERPAAANTHG
jgi:lipopolysaccharide transport system ATP-binding protein